MLKNFSFAILFTLLGSFAFAQSPYGRVLTLDNSGTQQWIDIGIVLSTYPTYHPGSPSPAWLTNGNNILGTAFLGTTNNQPLIFKTNYTETMRLTATGNLGIGTNNPAEKLDVAGNVRFTGALMPNGSAGTTGEVLVSQGAGNPPQWSTITSLETDPVYSGWINATGSTTNQILRYNGTKYVPTSTGNLGTSTTGVTITNGSNAVIGSGTTIDIATASGTTTGLLTSTDWTTFNNKLSSTLNSGYIFVGNASNVATGVALSGDATISNTGAITVTGLQSRSVANTSPTNGQVLTWNNSTTQWEPQTPSSDWSLSGNSLTGSEKLGSTNNQPVVVITNNQETFRFNPPGTSAPAWSIQRGGGDPRGLHVVDLQSARSAATQVASGDYSVIGGGRDNTASGGVSTVGGGYQNTASGSRATVGGGEGNTASGSYSAIPGGSYLTVGARSFGFSGQTSVTQTDLSTNSNIAAFVDVDLWLYSRDFTNASQLRFYEAQAHGSGANYVALQAPTSLSANTTYTLPASLTTTNTVATGILQTDASGNLSWISPTGLAAATAWTLTGNAITGTEFLGTTNNQPLVIRVNSTQTFQFNTNLSLQRDAGGNARGQEAVDLQSARSAATQVASGNYSVIGGGLDNTTSGQYATVGGGGGNMASGVAATVGGGGSNTASGDLATVGGGYQNTASGLFTTVGGGYQNTASGDYSVIGGGWENTASSFYATVSGGYQNTASGYIATVGGGEGNTASNDYATVGGGRSNTASSTYATVGGGYGNTASGGAATIGGGVINTASGYTATVGGGYQNTASGWYATVGGGGSNTASGNYSVVPGGYSNTANANYNLVFGENVDPSVTETHRVYFFGDGTSSNPSGSLVINRLDGDHPIHVGTNNTNGNGAYLTAGGTWTNGSSRSFKERFMQYRPAEVLEKIRQLPVEGYFYKGTEEYHITPMAEDFYRLFGTGVHEIIETDSTGQLVRRPNPDVDKYLAASDVAGVALLGVKALDERMSTLGPRSSALAQRLEALEQENQQIKQENQRFRQQLEQVMERLALLEAQLSNLAESQK